MLRKRSKSSSRDRARPQRLEHQLSNAPPALMFSQQNKQNCKGYNLQVGHELLLIKLDE
jgi:hypothetical protein